MLSSPSANHLKNGGFESSNTLVGALNQSIAFAFSAQNSWGFLMDFSHSALRFSPEETFAILGLYLSLKGKLASDICYHSYRCWEELAVENISFFSGFL